MSGPLVDSDVMAKLFEEKLTVVLRKQRRRANDGDEEPTVFLGSCREELGEARQQIEKCVPIELFSTLLWSAGIGSWKSKTLGEGRLYVFLSKGKARQLNCRQHQPGKRSIFAKFSRGLQAITSK